MSINIFNSFVHHLTELFNEAHLVKILFEYYDVFLLNISGSDIIDRLAKINIPSSINIVHNPFFNGNDEELVKLTEFHSKTARKIKKLKISDMASIDYLRFYTNLEELEISWNYDRPHDDYWVDYLLNNTNLRKLSIHKFVLSKKILGIINKLNLETLELVNIRFNHREILGFELPRLKHLKLIFVLLPDVTYSITTFALENLINLETFETNIPINYSLIASCPKLHTLNIPNIIINNPGIAPYRLNIKTLITGHNEFLPEIIKSMRQLEKLKIEISNYVIFDMSSLENLLCLTHLEIYVHNYDKIRYMHLEKLNRLPKLKSLSLSYDAKTINQIIDSVELPNLVTLIIKYIGPEENIFDQVSYRLLDHIVRNFSNLTSLEIYGDVYTINELNKLDSLTQLETLIIKTKIKYVDDVQLNLSFLKKLKKLTISFNFSNLSNCFFGKNFLDNFTNLEYLHLCCCPPIKGKFIVPSGLKNLAFLDIPGNNIKELVGIEKLTSLNYLNCSCNPIKNLDMLSKLRYIQHLDIQLVNTDFMLLCMKNKKHLMDLSINSSAYITDKQATCLRSLVPACDINNEYKYRNLAGFIERFETNNILLKKCENIWANYTYIPIKPKPIPPNTIRIKCFSFSDLVSLLRSGILPIVDTMRAHYANIFDDDIYI